jgi:Ca2+-binding EF-hand superfamily protein
VLDQNGDGLICNNDLFSIATASTRENPLINKDIFKIFQYVDYFKGQAAGAGIVNDTVVD